MEEGFEISSRYGTLFQQNKPKENLHKLRMEEHLMKLSRKILSLAICVALLLSLSVVAFAMISKTFLALLQS